MIYATPAIVLRSIRYGETSLIATLFTREHGIQSFLVKGIRSSSSKGRSSRAGLLQPATLLDIEAYYRPQSRLQHLKEFSPACFYQQLQQDVVRNSIALFSVELLLRLLPEGAALPDLFDFSRNYLETLDRQEAHAVANFPLAFALQCGRNLGYEIAGNYSDSTPYLSLPEGAFRAEPPAVGTTLNHTDTAALAQLIQCRRLEDLSTVEMNGTMRYRLLDWYLEFLHRHTDHMHALKSLAVLRAILH